VRQLVEARGHLERGRHAIRAAERASPRVTIGRGLCAGVRGHRIKETAEAKMEQL
jgi:hypothetical protein